MQDDPNRRVGRQREPLGSADSARAMGDSIRQAFLTHMSEQQRQFAAPVAARRAVERLDAKKR
ncbi:MAG: hypothetical protein ACLQJR_26465 [Stellaceae bacterium]